VITWMTLALMTVGSVGSLGSTPPVAVYGLASLFLYVLPALVFLVPITLVAAELASGWSGGVYNWVREGISAPMGLLAVWCQFAQTIFARLGGLAGGWLCRARQHGHALAGRLGDGSASGRGVILAVVAERQRGVRPLVQGVGDLVGLDVDRQQLPAPAEGEAQPADAARELGGANDSIPSRSRRPPNPATRAVQTPASEAMCSPAAVVLNVVQVDLGGLGGVVVGELQLADLGGGHRLDGGRQLAPCAHSPVTAYLGSILLGVKVTSSPSRKAWGRIPVVCSMSDSASDCASFICSDDSRSPSKVTVIAAGGCAVLSCPLIFISSLRPGGVAL
jgi:hypothetical protein